MGKAKPCLGYPSRTAAAVALQDQGLSYKQIAHKMGISNNCVSGLISSAKRAITPARYAETAKISPEIFARLQPDATARGVSVNNLCEYLLATIADDGLATAILDDALEIKHAK